jgi:cytochrome b involved in lipid metabolism
MTPPLSSYDIAFRFLLFILFAVTCWLGFKRRAPNIHTTIKVPEELERKKRMLTRNVTRRELFDHGNSKESTVWISVFGLVFDISDFQDEHPGGSERLLKYVGKDATTEFDEFSHSAHAYERMLGMIVGVLKTDEDRFKEKLTHLRRTHQLSDTLLCTSC